MSRRANFTNPVKRAAYARSKGSCECHLVPHLPTFRVGCGARLGIGNTFYEHIDPDYISGRGGLDNCATLTRTCWKLKTATYDLPVIAKVKRQMDRARGIRSNSGRPLPGGRDDRLKKKINRRVVERFGS